MRPNPEPVTQPRIRGRLLLRAARRRHEVLDADGRPLPILKTNGGHLTVNNIRLAHRLCNRVDYSKQIRRPHAKDLARAKPAAKATPAFAAQERRPRRVRIPSLATYTLSAGPRPRNGRSRALRDAVQRVLCQTWAALMCWNGLPH